MQNFLTPFVVVVFCFLSLKLSPPLLLCTDCQSEMDFRTPDEDFGILLRAAKLYDDMTHDLDTYPRLLFVITGKGPMKEEYREKMSRMKFRKVAFRLLWLTAEDYPRLVSAADLGVSLHV